LAGINDLRQRMHAERVRRWPNSQPQQWKARCRLRCSAGSFGSSLSCCQKRSASTTCSAYLFAGHGIRRAGRLAAHRHRCALRLMRACPSNYGNLPFARRPHRPSCRTTGPTIGSHCQIRCDSSGKNNGEGNESRSPNLMVVAVDLFVSAVFKLQVLSQKKSCRAVLFSRPPDT
jgi:hypothetical protein